VLLVEHKIGELHKKVVMFPNFVLFCFKICLCDDCLRYPRAMMQNFATFAIFFLYAKSMRFARYHWGLQVGACVGSYEDLT
jgi:hypothetical protein